MGHPPSWESRRNAGNPTLGTHRPYGLSALSAVLSAVLSTSQAYHLPWSRTLWSSREQGIASPLYKCTGPHPSVTRLFFPWWRSKGSITAWLGGAHRSCQAVPWLGVACIGSCGLGLRLAVRYLGGANQPPTGPALPRLLTAWYLWFRLRHIVQPRRRRI